MLLQVTYLRVGEVTLFVSYHGGGWGMEDFELLQVNVRPFVPTKVGALTCTPQQLAMRYVRHAVTDVMSQVTRNFANIFAFIAPKFDVTRLLKQGPVGEAPAGEDDGGHDTAPSHDLDGENGGDTGSASDGRELLFGRQPEASSSVFKKGLKLFRKS